MKSIPNLPLQSFKKATKDETDLQVTYLPLKDHWERLWVMKKCSICWWWWELPGCVHFSKLFKIYTKSRYILFYVNFTLIKFIFSTTTKKTLNSKFYNWYRKLKIPKIRNVCTCSFCISVHQAAYTMLYLFMFDNLI